MASEDGLLESHFAVLHEEHAHHESLLLVL